ncbi:MAG: hypothetical protein Q9224_005163 [Gallowayella concinna]
MDTTDLTNLLENLDDDIDELEESLAPLIKHALVESASTLPLLDKAQLYILVTYAIESILFSYLRLNGVDAKEHVIFGELARVRQYFEKVDHVEKLGSKRDDLSLNKAATERIIKHALSGNKQHHSKVNEQQQYDGHLRVHVPSTPHGQFATTGSKHREKRAGNDQGKATNKRTKFEHGSLEGQNFEGEWNLASIRFSGVLTLSLGGNTVSKSPALSPHNSIPVTTAHFVQPSGTLGKEANRRKRNKPQTYHASNQQGDLA